MNLVDHIRSTYTFAEKAYKQFDESHDILHAMKVVSNALLIFADLESTFGTKVVDYCKLLVEAAMLHDVRDSKYIGSGLEISQEDLEKFFEEDPERSVRKDKVLHIINNISWSKEQKGENVVFEDPLDELVRIIVQEADWLEAIGDVGLQRCIDYSTKKFAEDDVCENVCNHIRTKLLLIPDQLKLEKSKQMAENLVIPLHIYLYNFDSLNFKILEEWIYSFDYEKNEGVLFVGFLFGDFHIDAKIGTVIDIPDYILEIQEPYINYINEETLIAN